jgi:hypothetical protein
MPDEHDEAMLRERAIAEVIELHRFFVDWLGAGEGGIERLAHALAAEFRMVPPSGAIVGRQQVIDMLAGGRGSRGSAFRIAVDEIDTAEIAAGHCLATYIERQDGPDGPTARRSSALFRAAACSPNGVQWLHLQETWIEGARP